MENFHLVITQDQKNAFFALYDGLGPLQQQIWRRIVWYTQKYPNAHPTQNKVAKGIPCSRKHVNRTLALFKSYGWLSLISRGHKRAKTLCIPLYLGSIDVINREYFRKVEVTSEVTHSTLSGRRTSKVSGSVKTFSKKEPLLTIPSYLDRLKIPYIEKLKISLCSKEAYEVALSHAKDQARMGRKIKDDIAYVRGATLKIAKQRGEKLNWKAFYASL